jgi:hypothetical protein
MFHLSLIGKVFKVFYVIFLIISIIIATLASINYFIDYWNKDRLRVFNEIDGISLGWSKDDLYFRKGEPDLVIEDEPPQPLVYGKSTVYLTKENQIQRILYLCSEKGFSPYDVVAGITCGTNIEKVISKFGDPVSVSVSADKLKRIYNYPQYNLAFGLSKSEVNLLAVFDSTKHDFGLVFQNEDNQKPIKKDARVPAKPWEKY